MSDRIRNTAKDANNVMIGRDASRLVVAISAASVKDYLLSLRIEEPDVAYVRTSSSTRDSLDWSVAYLHC